MIKKMSISIMTKSRKSYRECDRQTTEESLEFGEIDAKLNFQPLTEADMIQQSKSALEAYRRIGSGVEHERVRECLSWARE